VFQELFFVHQIAGNRTC